MHSNCVWYVLTYSSSTLVPLFSTWICHVYGKGHTSWHPVLVNYQFYLLTQMVLWPNSWLPTLIRISLAFYSRSTAHCKLLHEATKSYIYKCWPIVLLTLKIGIKLHLPFGKYNHLSLFTVDAMQNKRSYQKILEIQD